VGRGDVADRQDRFLRELSQERAPSLLRISRTLESAIAHLGAARQRIARLGGAERRREIVAYRELRQYALKYRWYLEVQREALGMRHHHLLDEFYRIPEPIDR
jgi:hypothetical protein